MLQFRVEKLFMQVTFLDKKKMEPKQNTGHLLKKNRIESGLGLNTLLKNPSNGRPGFKNISTNCGGNFETTHVRQV